MSKTLVGPKLRRLRLANQQTQAEMAKALGLSPSYINLLENNQRSLSVKVLIAISDVYGVDWRDLTTDESAQRLADLRSILADPVFGSAKPDLQEFRAAIDHAPVLVDRFVDLYRSHRVALEKIMKRSGSGGAEALLQSSPEAVIHDFFRNQSNHFPALEAAADASRARHPALPEDHFSVLKHRLAADHGISVAIRPIDDMAEALRTYDVARRQLDLSQALDTANRVFQLAHMLCLVENADLLDEIIAQGGLGEAPAMPRLRVELANYFAAAYLMPYAEFLHLAETTRYDLDRVATHFSVSFEQVCQRLTTLQRDGARGVPFFFLRVDKAGNVTKRFNSTSFNLAEYGGSCPVWNVHTAFYSPGIILPQFVEVPDGARFFSFSRTVHRPVFSWDTQDRRLTLALGCDATYVDRIGYASKFNQTDPGLYAQIGINCHICPRQACTQRAHQPMFIDLPMDENRRGSTRYES